MSVVPYRRRGYGGTVWDQVRSLKWLADQMTDPFAKQAKKIPRYGKRPASSSSRVSGSAARKRPRASVASKGSQAGYSTGALMNKATQTIKKFLSGGRRSGGRFVGGRGYISKKIKLKKSTRPVSYAKLGSEELYQAGGHRGNGEKVVAGHSTAIYGRLMFSVGRSLYRMALRVAGIHFNDWGESTLGGWNMTIYYKYGHDGATQSSISNTGGTHFLAGNNVAQTLIDLQRAGAAGTEDEVVHLIKIIFQPATGIQTVDIPMQACDIKFTVKSSLRLQNRTHAKVDNTTGDHEVHDVEANPLVVKGWSFSGSTILPQGNTLGAHGGAEVSPDTGIVTADPGTSALMPANSYFKNAKKCGTFTMAPGAIHTSYCSQTKVIRINVLMRMLRRYFFVNSGASTNHGECRLGFGKFYFFEKVLDTRIALEEADVYVGFEVNNYIGSAAFFKRKTHAERIVTNVTTALP
jgi:hypothetical protein